MWIRSQNGESLRKYEGLVINFHNKKQILGEPNFYQPDGKIVEGYILGDYDSEKRALEVFEEIQRALLGNLTFGMNSNTKIYQMPEK